MEKCFYNDKIIYAQQVNNNFYDEEIIRKASRNNKLKCLNKDCFQPVYYRHGDKRAAHFAHKKNTDNCDYYNFYKKIKKRNDIMKKVILNCFIKLIEKYGNNNVKMEEKVVDSFYSDIIITNNESKVAIEFIYKYKTPIYMANMIEKYKNANIKLICVIVENDILQNLESEFNNAKRLQLYLGNQTLIILNEDGINIKLIKSFENGELCNFNTNFDKLDFFNDKGYSLEFDNYFNETFLNTTKSLNNINSINLTNEKLKKCINYEIDEKELLELLNNYFKNIDRVKAGERILAFAKTEKGNAMFMKIFNEADKDFSIKMQFQFQSLIKKI